MSSTPSRVVLVRCNTYDQNAVNDAVGRALSLLGGTQTFMNPEEHLLLKPNLLAADPPEKNTATHPAVFQAVAYHLQKAGAKLSYGDSPAPTAPLPLPAKQGLLMPLMR